MKKNQTRRALLMSALSLLLCVSMLVGSTFAWFTDSVTSANNIIKSGNLDVELYYQVEGQSDWTKVTETTNVFMQNALWEPGHTEVVKLKVVNEGSLALKYTLGVNIVSEVGSVNVADENFKLSDYIKYGIVGGAQTYTREQAVEAVDAAAVALKTAYKSDTLSLEPKNDTDSDEKIVTMVVYMPTTVGNEANHKTGAVQPTINLGINVFATQYTYEEDSFDEMYDKDAIFYDKLVTTNEELKAAIENAKVKVIAIEGDLTYDWGSGSYENSKALLLKGKTLKGYSGNDSVTFKGYGSANPITDVTLMDITVKDETVGDNEKSWEHGHLEFVSLKAINVTFANTVMLDGNSTITNCTMNNTQKSWYGVWVEGGNTVIENCTFTGTRAVKIHEAYGSEVESVVINNNKFTELSEKPGVVIGDLNADTAVALTNNEFVGTQAGDQGKYSYESDTDVTTFKFTDKDNKIITNDGSLPNGLYQDENGAYYATTSDGLSAGIGKVQAGETVVLSKDVTYTGNGYANITKDITLDLNGNTLNTTSNGVIAKAGTIKNGTVANPVGGRAALRTWSGVSIENVVVESPENGGITVASGNSLPSIKNVTINAKTYGIELQYGASVETIENVNIVAGENGIVVQAGTIGKITNSVIEGKITGIRGQLKGIYDLKVAVDGTNEIRGGNYGIYLFDEGAAITNPGSACLDYADAAAFVGGVKDMEFAFGQSGKLIINGAKVGAFISSAEELFAFAKAVNEEGKSFANMVVYLTADIDLENVAWTPVGQTGKTQFEGTFDGQGYTIKNLKVDASEQTGANYSSGLFGWLNNATVKNVNFVNAAITGNHNVGVVAGYMETAGCTISNCHVVNATVVANHANDDACGDKVGVIVGHAGNAGVKVEQCSAKDCTVPAGRDAGQIAGAAKAANVVDCTATNVTVTAGGDCTGANIRNEIIGRVL